MSSEWQEVKLSEIADFQNSYAFNSREYVPESAESKEILRMGHIQRGGGFKEDEKPVYAPLSSKGSDSRYCLDKDDIVITTTDMKDRIAILANCARIPSSGRFLLNQRVGRIRTRNQSIADQDYLYYFMNSSSQVPYLRSMANRGFRSTSRHQQ
jgi:type I restriction enzyme S subunit